MRLSQISLYKGGIFMSDTKFITDMLNINKSDIEFIHSFSQSDGSILIRIRLKSVSDVYCPYCGKSTIKKVLLLESSFTLP